jgi:hypothetical protein
MRSPLRSRLSLLFVAGLVASAALLSTAGGAGAASPIGADGTVHACYKAKGKAKGTLRVVPTGKACKKKRHEKPIVWALKGPAGTSGAAATQGDVSGLLDLIHQQSAAIDSLKGQLQAVLTPVCSQLTILTQQANLLRSVINGLGLNGVLTGLGGLLIVPTVPAPLDAFDCPALSL